MRQHGSARDKNVKTGHFDSVIYRQGIRQVSISVIEKVDKSAC